MYHDVRMSMLIKPLVCVVYVSKITNNINFRAGKVHLFSDFDGTYLPVRHSALYNLEPNADLKEYVTKIDTLLKSGEDDLFFHITTGRTFGEYEEVSKLIRSRGLELPLPHSFIAKNGADEYIKSATDIEFYKGGKFPFEYYKPNLAKENLFVQTHKWDGFKIKTFIKALADKYNINLIEGDSENSVRDYGEKSLFSKGKLNKKDWELLPRDGEKFTHYEKQLLDSTIGFRNDGNLKIHMIFPPEYGPCAEVNTLYDKFMDAIKAFLEKEKVDYKLKWEPASKYNYYRNSCSITPNIDGEVLTKLFDTKQALKKAIKENDMVIVAGDGSNDFKMLNPLEYIEKEFWQECEKKSSNKEFYRKGMREKLEDLCLVLENKSQTPYIKSLSQELTENGFLKKLEELPFYSIVMKDSDSSLDILVKTFQKMKKVIVTKSGFLDEGVKSAIEFHANRKDSFKESLSQKLREYINPKEAVSSGSSASSVNKKSPKYVVAGFLLIGLGGLYYHFSHKKQGGQNNENLSVVA